MTATDANWRGYALAAWLGLAVLLGTLGMALVLGRGNELSFIGLLLTAVAVATLLHGYLPSLVILLIVISALLAMNGSLWSLYRRSPPYDEIAHGVTTMALALAGTWYNFRPVLDALRSRRWLLAATVFIAGLSLGAGWEVIEYCFILPEEKMTLHDTVVDLAVDGVGAALGGVLAIAIRNQT